MLTTNQFIEAFRRKYSYSLILLKQLVITEFKLRYQGSVLGYLWSLLKPLFLFLILYVVFVFFLRIGSDIPHWPVAMLLGIVLWNFFSEITNGGLRAVVSRGGLLRNIFFPKYTIIVSSAISALINLLLNLTIVIVFMIINGVGFHPTMLLFPIFVIEILLFSLGISFLLGAIYVKLRDVQYIWEIIMQGLFYASAIIYPISRVAEINVDMVKIVLLNPVAQAVQCAREVFVFHDTNLLGSILNDGSRLVVLITSAAVSILVFIIGAWYFKKRSPYFAEDI